jgi:RNA polymerase sigma factor (sigma-70 family)
MLLPDLGFRYNNAYFSKLLNMDVQQRDTIELFHLCASDRDNSDAWDEFLRRYTAKIKYFIRGAMRQARMGFAHPVDTAAFQECDFFQNTIVRLVENDCAAMRKFSGASENALSAYLAVICRSVVFDTMRYSSASKRRRPADALNDESIDQSSNSVHLQHDSMFDRPILIQELMSFAFHNAKPHSGEVSQRDQLIFQLHFFDGLSHSQIARCEGINLSKAGVEKALKRLVERVQFLASSRRSEETLQ